MLFSYSILFIFSYLINSILCDYSYWQNGESPIIFNDLPSVQERTNFPFHNVQFESNYPIQRSYVVEIPTHEKQPPSSIVDENQQQTIGDKLNALLPDQNEKEKVMEIVDSRNKSLLQKITELSKVLSKSSKSHALDQSELLHGFVETDRKRQNTLKQLQNAIQPEFKAIANKFVNIERNFTLSDIQKQAGHDDILGNLAVKAKSALKDFESFLKSSPRTRRQLESDVDWKMRSTSMYSSRPSSEYVSMVPSSAIPNDGNYADHLTKNRFMMPTPIDRESNYPPTGFFPQGPTQPPIMEFIGPGGDPRPPFATTTPISFGTDLSDYKEDDKAYGSRNKLFKRQQKFHDDSGSMQLNFPQWNNNNDQRSQIVEKQQQTIIHSRIPITPEVSRNNLIVKNKVEIDRVPQGSITNYAQQTISQSAVPVFVNPPNNQVITKSHIETVRPVSAVATGQSYGSYGNSIPSMDVQVSPGVMSNIPSSGGVGIAPLSSGGIGRYDTHIDRYDTGEGKQINRFEIPATFLQEIQRKIPGIIEAPINQYRQNQNPYGSNPYASNIPGTFEAPINPYRQSPYGSNTGLPPSYISNYQPHVPSGYISNNQPNMPPGYISSNQPMGQPVQVYTRPNPPPESYIPTEIKPKIIPNNGPVNTRILTNDQFKPNIIPDPNTVILNPEKTQEQEESFLPTTTEEPSATPYPSFPDYRHELFPIPLNQAKADNRPASGTVRRQDMFGGGTNEYRQDNGRISEPFNKEINNQRHWPSAVDDRRRSGYIDPLVQYGPPSPNFALENRPLPPYDSTSIAEQRSGYMEGDDLSRTDPFSFYGRKEPMFTTPIPWNTQTTTIVAIPSIDVDPKLNFPGNRASRPTEKEIIQNRLTEDARRFPEKGQIRPYFGPEEITRSRYVNVNPPENNLRDGVSDRFIKIDLPNISSI